MGELFYRLIVLQANCSESLVLMEGRLSFGGLPKLQTVMQNGGLCWQR